jgi:hypothetical protein
MYGISNIILMVMDGFAQGKKTKYYSDGDGFACLWNLYIDQFTKLIYIERVKLTCF